MKRTEEISKLVIEYTSRLKEVNPELKWANYQELLVKLEEYRKSIESTGKVNEEWFNTNCINGKSIQGEIFEHANTLDDRLFELSIRLRNLNSENRFNQISSSTTHFKYLTLNSKKPLENLGFKLFEKKQYKHRYINENGIIIELVYQRYDPPEVWIRRKEDNSALILNRTVENFFNGNDQIWQKYSGENNMYFDYSKFDYYFDLLNSIISKIGDMEGFVYSINNWIKEQHLENETDL